jgi:hypothetical protein
VSQVDAFLMWQHLCRPAQQELPKQWMKTEPGFLGHLTLNEIVALRQLCEKLTRVGLAGERHRESRRYTWHQR